MIQFVELECPNCGAKLQKTKKDIAKCNHCGAEFLIDDGPEIRVYKAPRQNKKSGNGVMWLFLVGVTVLFVIILAKADFSDRKTTVENLSVEQENKQEEMSELFRKFLEEVYNVPYEKVTKEQLAQITYLHVFWKGGCDIVEYALKDGGIQKVEFLEDLSVNLADIQKFTGLKSLEVERHTLSAGDLHGLKNLTKVWARNTPEEFLQIIENPENITSLGCCNISTMHGIDAFKNLEELYIEDGGYTDRLTDISGLSALKQLKRLYLYGVDEVSDLGVLYSLSGLEELTIESETLKDVSFLQHMTSLQYLSITDSIVLDISPLASLTTIKHLELVDNYEIEDYSVLSELVNLETLNLDLCSTNTMPSAEGWTKLTNLSIQNAEDIRFLNLLPNLRFLTMSGCDCSQQEVFATLKKLETLNMTGIYGDITDLRALQELTNLKSLDISSMKLYGNVEYLFGIPNLKELNINDCSFGLDFAAIPENQSLKILHMDRLALWENIQVSYDGMFTSLYYDEVMLADHISFVSKFPNLEELYLQSNKLTEVNFTEGIPMLKKLDITNNYITDLRPLGKLSHLEVVWCGENAISQGSDLGEDITVILDSEAEDSWWWK